MGSAGREESGGGEKRRRRAVRRGNGARARRVCMRPGGCCILAPLPGGQEGQGWPKENTRGGPGIQTAAAARSAGKQPRRARAAGRSPRAARQASAACPNSCSTPKHHCAVSRSDSRRRAGCRRASAAPCRPLLQLIKARAGSCRMPWPRQADPGRASVPGRPAEPRSRPPVGSTSNGRPPTPPPPRSPFSFFSFFSTAFLGALPGLLAAAFALGAIVCWVLCKCWVPELSSDECL